MNTNTVVSYMRIGQNGILYLQKKSRLVMNKRLLWLVQLMPHLSF